MDANGLRFWLLGDANHWRRHDHTRWDADCGVLCLASERTLEPPADPAAAFAAANAALEVVPRAVDGSGAVAHWEPSANAVVTRSHLPGEAVTVTLPAAPTDLAVGYDGILYCTLADSVVMHDLRGRWADVTVPAAGFVPWRLAADPSGGVWLLERAGGRLARLTGAPLPLGPYVDYTGTVFRPDPENCHQPALHVLADLGWPAGERPVALACAADGSLGLLAWAGDGNARLRPVDTAAERLLPGLDLAGARYAYSLAWLNNGNAGGRITVRMPGRRDAPAFDPADADGTATVQPSGDVYPLAADAEEASFAHRLESPPHYPVTIADGGRGTEPLYRLSIANLARSGEATNFRSNNPYLLDSGSQTTVWHRLYAEAHIPAGTGFVAYLAATAEPTPPDTNDTTAWLPHRFGEPAVDTIPQTPRAAWEHAPSELPNHPGLGPWEHEPGKAGLLSVLIQNARRRVRTLTGRYLWVRITLTGDGRTGPRIAALRAYGSRFSYRDQYLPRLYRETVFGAPAALPGAATGTIVTDITNDLNNGGNPNAHVLENLRKVGVDPGAEATIIVEIADRRWRIHEASGSRVWQLQSKPAGIDIYPPQATPTALPGVTAGTIDVTFTAALNAGGNPSADLLEHLRAAGADLGAGSTITVETASQRWRIREASGDRAWQLEARSVAFDIYRPQATPADFLERLLDNFEGLLTPLEDRIASAYLLSDPTVIPETDLDWLGSWIGVAFDPALPEGRRRAWLAAAPYLARLHGSRAGLQLALDIASGGGVSSGAIVVLEDFRLRRILTTLLGVDLNDENDPLLPGLVVSGNSVVGDTLALGEKAGVELLALFRSEVASAAESRQVIDFLDRLANRATVLVHQGVTPQDLGLLRRVVELEAPAHVLTRVLTAEWPFLVGIASLIGTDTYLGPPRTPRAARADISALGRDYVIGPASLDPRMAGAAGVAPPAVPPTADAGDDFTAPWGTSFTLDGSRSHAAPGHSLSNYIWRRLLQL